MIPRLVASLMMVVAVGCSQPRIGGKPGVNDALRARVVEMERQVKAVERENGELRARLNAAEHALPPSDSPHADPERPVDSGPSFDPQVIREATPVVAAIAIQRLSHAVDVNGDDIADLLNIYIQPTDGRGRFLQIVGRMELHAAALPGHADAVTLGRASVEPLEIREAYRSGFMGTHYVFSIPLDPARMIDVSGKSLVVRAVFHDAITGASHEATREVRIDASSLQRASAPEESSSESP